MTPPRPPLKGRKLGDRRVVVNRPHSAFFRYAGPGVMVAKAAASAPTTAVGRRLARVRAFVFGKPLSSAQEIEERLSKKLALPIFSSDAISSSAYATDEILRVLVLAGLAWMTWSIWVAAAIALMLTIVAFSYRQVCRGYPSGGGAYVVARENLGPNFGLIAAAALMVDYVMTVAVSSASALANLGSAFPSINPFRVEICAIVIILVTAANLRGIRESGNIFALPTYLFVGMALLAIGVGIVNTATGSAHHLAPPALAESAGVQAFTILLLLKAFAGGSVALTGVQAAGSKERGQHADHHGHPSGRDLHRAHVRRPPVRRPCHRHSRPHDPGPDWSGGIQRRLLPAVHHAANQRGPDPLPGLQHQFQRLPTPGRNPRQG